MLGCWIGYAIFSSRGREVCGGANSKYEPYKAVKYKNDAFLSVILMALGIYAENTICKDRHNNFTEGDMLLEVG